MLERFYEKNSTSLINLIGCWCIFLGLINFFRPTFFEMHLLHRSIFLTFFSIVSGLSVAGGFLFLRKNRIGWIAVVSTITFLMAYNIFLISIYYSYLSETKTGGLLDLINHYSFDPWTEIRGKLSRLVGFLLLLAVLLNQVFLNNIEYRISNIEYRISISEQGFEKFFLIV